MNIICSSLILYACLFVLWICLFLQLWRACSTLVARSRASSTAGTQVKTCSAKSKQDFPDDLDQRERPDELKSPVCSYNEWDPLEEVIVGRVEGAVKYIELQCIHALLFAVKLTKPWTPEIFMKLSYGKLANKARDN